MFGRSKRHPRPDPARFELLNLGCGQQIHPAWLNVDLTAHAPGVLAHDLRCPLPFVPGSFRAIYHSHVLEHLARPRAAALIGECFLALKPGGILRCVVPDLETIARLYLENLQGALSGERAAAERYDWIILELLDQMVRDRSGGEMAEYWRQRPMPAEEFVFARAGSEVRAALNRKKSSAAQLPPGESAPRDAERFRATGEVHRWMYDRFSLRRLLERSGFTNVRVCTAGESSIPEFAGYGFDLTAEGIVRKPDSLFMEGLKP